MAAITNFPPALFSLISSRKHVQIGLVGAPLLLALTSFFPHIHTTPLRERRQVRLLTPLALNGLSGAAESAERPS